MNDQQLKQELESVGRRDRQLAVRCALAVVWISLALVVCAVIARGRGAGSGVMLLLLPLVAVLIVALPRAIARVRASRDPLWLGRRIENRFPNLNARLLTALEQRPKSPDGELGFLQQSVIGEALEHARGNSWTEIVPAGRFRAATIGQWVSLLILVAALGVLAGDLRGRGGLSNYLALAPATSPVESFEVKIEPEDTS